MSNELSLSDAATVLGVRQETALKLLDGALLTQTCESFNSDRPRFHAKVFQAQAEGLRDRAEFGEADHYHDGHHGKHAGDFVVTKGRRFATGSRVRGSRRNAEHRRPDAVIPQVGQSRQAAGPGLRRPPEAGTSKTADTAPTAKSAKGSWPDFPIALASQGCHRPDKRQPENPVDNHGQVDTVLERGNERKPLPGPANQERNNPKWIVLKSAGNSPVWLPRLEACFSAVLLPVLHQRLPIVGMK